MNNSKFKKLFFTFFFLIVTGASIAQDMQSRYTNRITMGNPNCRNEFICSIVEDYVNERYKSAFDKLERCSALTDGNEMFGKYEPVKTNQIWCKKNLVGFYKRGTGVAVDLSQAKKNFDEAIDLIKQESDRKKLPRDVDLNIELDRYWAELQFEHADSLLSQNNLTQENSKSIAQLLNTSAQYGYPKAIALIAYLQLSSLDSTDIMQLELIKKIQQAKRNGFMGDKYFDSLLFKHENFIADSCSKKTVSTQPQSNPIACKVLANKISCDVYSPIEICSIKINNGNCKLSDNDFSMQRYIQLISQKNYTTGARFEITLNRCNILLMDINSNTSAEIKLRFQ